MQCIVCEKPISLSLPHIPDGPCCSLKCESRHHARHKNQKNPKVRQKYGNKKVYHGDLVFHSRGEFRRYLVLQDELRRGDISCLELQPEFAVVVSGKHICFYYADFRYERGGETVVEDFKSTITAKNKVYRLKKKLVEALYPITITEVFEK